MGIPTLEELSLLHENICQALSDPKRIQILFALHEQPYHVSELAELLDMPQPTVSRHLSVLRQRALVVTERKGATILYRIADERIIHVLETMRQLLRDVMERRTHTLK